ncbi:unnamed protein product [Fusarium langsethiae]|nr:unnamed protein product [Fusarium langsethiae]
MGKRLAELEVHDEEADLEGLPCPEAPLLSLIPEPHGPEPIPAHRQMLRFAIQRTAPKGYSIVQGAFASKLVSTLVEQERGPLPTKSVYHPRGFPFYARHVAGITGRSDEDLLGEILGGTESQDEGSTDQQFMRHDTLGGRVRGSAQMAQRENFNPGPQIGGNSATFGPSSGSLVRQVHAQDAPPTPSKQLSQMLEKYHGFLTEINQEEKRTSTEDDSDDEAAMDLGDIALPEPENDEEYCPKKKSSRKPLKNKTSSVRKTGRQAGRPRKATLKKNDNVTPKKIGGQTNTGAGEGRKQNSSNIQKTPTKKHMGDSPLSSGPPSSGRIKLTVRPSQTSTPAEPSNPEPGITIPREDPPSPTRAPIYRVKYAISAKYATYASMSTHARFAQTAVHSAKGIADITTIGVPDGIIDPKQLTLEFSKIKQGGKQHADRAEFAWRAERADFAGTAFGADGALQVLTKGDHSDAKGTG